MNCVTCGCPIEPDDYCLSGASDSAGGSGWQHSGSRLLGCEVHRRTILGENFPAKYLTQMATPPEGYVEDAVAELDEMLKELGRG